MHFLMQPAPPGFGVVRAAVLVADPAGCASLTCLRGRGNAK